MAERKTLESYLNAKFGFHPRSGQHLVLDCLQALALIHPNERVGIAEVACTVISAIGNLSHEDEEFSINISVRGGSVVYCPGSTPTGGRNYVMFDRSKNGIGDVSTNTFEWGPEEVKVNLDALRRYASNREQFIFDCTREYYEANGFFLDKEGNRREAKMLGREWDESKACVDHYWPFVRNDDRFLVIPSYSPCLQVSVRYRNWQKIGITE